MGMKGRKKREGSRAELDPTTRALVDAWENGARICDLEAKHGIKRSRIRRMIQKAVGGKDAFRAMRKTSAGGQTELFGGKRATGFTPPDDSKVKRVTRAPIRKGWRSEVIYVPAGPSVRPDSVFISPKGRRYVRASANEKADLIYDNGAKGIPPLRLKLQEGSAIERKRKRRSTQVKQGEEALKARRARKREKRKTRVKRKGGLNA